jgi:hypothetical protein
LRSGLLRKLLAERDEFGRSRKELAERFRNIQALWKVLFSFGR